MRSLIGLGLLLSLTGCTFHTVMQGHQLTSVDPTTNIPTNAKILVKGATGEDPVTNRRYLNNLIVGLQNKGYVNVSTDAQNPDFIATLDLFTEDRLIEEQKAVYRDVRAREVRKCETDKHGIERCTTDYFSQPKIIGYQTIQTPTRVAKMKLDIESTKSGNVLVHSVSYVNDQQCSVWKLYEFLVSQTVSRLNMSYSIDTPYSVEMPEGYSCRDGG